MKIDRANQVFALDTTYIPMARGFDVVCRATPLCRPSKAARRAQVRHR